MVAWGILLPILYILNILMHIKEAVLCEDYIVQDAISQQIQLNNAYRKANNMKGLLDPVTTGLE